MRIIIDQPIETLPTNEQDKIFVMSRTNEVFCRDANGELWQAVDCDVDADIVREAGGNPWAQSK